MVLVLVTILNGITQQSQAQTPQAVTPSPVFDSKLGFNPSNCYGFTATQLITAKNATSRNTTSLTSVNGAAFTPRDSMKVLVIFAGFTESFAAGASTCGDYNDPDWPQTDVFGNVGNTLPANLSSYCYTRNSQFNPAATDQTLSNYFYQMSRTAAKPFKVTFGYFPDRINIPASGRYPDIMGYQQDVLTYIRVTMK